MVQHRGILVEGIVLIGSMVAYPLSLIGSKLSFVVRRFFPQSSEISDSTATVLARLAVVLTTLQNKLDHATQEEAAFREQARAHLRNKDRAAALNSVRRADNKKKQASELCRQIQLIERQRLQLETMQTTEDVVNTQRELADVMKRANLSTLAADAETAAETISDGNADLEDARDVLSHDLPPVSEDDELLAQLEEEIMDEELSTLAQPPALQHRRDPQPFKPPPGANVPVAQDSTESFSPPASPTARETSTETAHAETAPLLNG